MKRFYFIFLALLSFVCSCDDDVEFRVGGSGNIGFSVDSLLFDTVFSDVPTSYQRFKVYNTSDDGVRISSVRLASNGESGFLVNFDGTSGVSFTDVEIYDRDSAFVFVKMLPRVQGSDLPVEINDSLVFTFGNGVEKCVHLQAFVQDAIVLRSLVVEGTEVLDGAKPYLIYDSLVVSSEGTLAIEAGTRLFFHNDADMRVHGRVLCNGIVDNPVVFRGMRTDKMLPYLPYDRLDGQWGGIRVFAESFGNEFHNADIHGGRYGISCDLSGVNDSKLYMTNSSIHNVASDALCMNYCAGTFINCEFSNAGGNCVTLIGGHTQFLHCTMAQFYPWDASRGSALYFCNVKNDTIYPLENADFMNCLITGYGDDEVYGSRLENNDAAFNCKFVNCVLNTDTENEASKKFFVNCISENEENAAFKSSNFKCVDTENYIYDFRLDSLSVARKVGDGGFYEYAPMDKDGVLRPDVNPDAGCYQYVEINK